ncbi:MAG: S-adenosylmethionine synthetase N-terminal domain-containing protein [Patescibacteria group bacterium]
MRSAIELFPGHPDKLCDIIAASIVDEYLKRDKDSKLNIAVSGGHGALFVTGEYISQADFDVAALARRVLSKHGIHEGLEPFIALEPVVSERVNHLRAVGSEAVMAFGFAAQESPGLIPVPVDLAKRIVKTIDAKREDEQWLWLGHPGSVHVSDLGKSNFQIHLNIDHGVQEIGTVRQSIQQEMEKMELPEKYSLKINPLGAMDKNDLVHANGKSGSLHQPYGSALPSQSNPSGLHFDHVSIIGQAIARNLALGILKSQILQAVFVRLLYRPGEARPDQIWIRDERGNDLSSLAKKYSLDIYERAEEWWRPGLMSEIAINGLIGNPNLPWEKGIRL